MPEFFEKVKKRLKKKLQTACGMCRDAAARMKKGRKPKLPAFLNLGGRGGIHELRRGNGCRGFNVKRPTKRPTDEKKKTNVFFCLWRCEILWLRDSGTRVELRWGTQ